MESVVLIGAVTVVPMVLLVMTCLLSRCHRKRTKEEIEREEFEKIYKKHMLPSYWGPLRVDFVRRPQDNLDTTRTSVSVRSDHTVYDEIATPSACKKDALVNATPRSPDSSIEKCCIVDEMNSTNTETNSSCSTQEGDVSGHVTKNWLHTPGQMASYISFRQTSHAILVVPSANNAVRAPNVVSAESRDNSDSDNNSMDYGSEGIQITVPKRLNFDSSGSEQMTKIKNISKKSNNETDFNLSCYYYDKDSRKEVSNTEISIDKTDPTYESIKSLTIPKIKLFKEKTGSHSSDPTYESLNSDLCFNFSRADGLDSARDDVSDGSNFRRSFESVKSGRDFTVFEINCDGNDEENDVFPENLSINSAHTLRHSYPGRLKESQTDSVTKRRNSINKCLNVSTNKIEEERYSPFPVAKKLSVNPRAKPVIASPRLCMIKTISGNLRPKSFQDSDENPVLNTPRSVPKIKIYDSDCIFNSSCLPSGQKDNSIPVLQNTESVSEVFDSIDDRIPTLKTYQTLRTIYSQARRAARTKKSLMSLPSVTEQTELELDQHLANNLYVKSTPRPVEEMVSVASSEYSDLCRK